MTISSNHLRSIIDRIENISAQKDDLSDDIKDIYTEAKSAGFDPKVIRMLIKLRKLSKEDRDEQDELISLYEDALNASS